VCEQRGKKQLKEGRQKYQGKKQPTSCERSSQRLVRGEACASVRRQTARPPEKAEERGMSCSAVQQPAFPCAERPAERVRRAGRIAMFSGREGQRCPPRMPSGKAGQRRF